MTEIKNRSIPENTMVENSRRNRSSLLKDIVYSAETIACFPSLTDFPIDHGFSWGKNSPNMAQRFAKSPQEAVLNTQRFLERARLSIFQEGVLIVPDQDDRRVLEVTEETYENKNKDEPLMTGASFIYTFLPEIPLIVKPADCHVVLVYAEAVDNGRAVVGLIHAGRRELDSQIPQKALEELKGKGFKNSDIHIGITPGISWLHYYVKEEDSAILTNPDWEKFTTRQKESVDGHIKVRLYLDLLGFLKAQLNQIPPENVEIYDIDTFEAARSGETFSHRYADSTNQPERNGRFIVAIQLRNE